MVYILMGVSGAGKTLIGKKLADRLGLPFHDGDDFHPEENVRKMKSGKPLNDRDRRPWLQTLAERIRAWNSGDGAVLACSALKKSYREILRGDDPANVLFIHLKGSLPLVASRLSERTEHFMPRELLKSQYEALEEPDKALEVSIDQPPEQVVAAILDRLDLPDK